MPFSLELPGTTWNLVVLRHIHKHTYTRILYKQGYQRPAQEMFILCQHLGFWEHVVYLQCTCLFVRSGTWHLLLCSFQSFYIYFVVILLFLGVSPTERMRNLKSPVRSPIPKLGSPIPSPMPGLQKLPQCTRCCNGIV